MPEAKFILKEPKSNTKTLIYLFYYFDNQRLKYSTGEKILVKYWNDTKQRARETSQFPEYPEFNQRLNNIEASVNTCYRRLLNDKQHISPDRLREELNKELKKEILTKKELDLLEWMEAEIEILKANKKVGSIQVYNALLKNLREFSISRKYKLSFENINLDFYEKFKDYILNEKKFVNNTFGKQIITLKTFLNLATAKGVNKNLIYKSRGFKAFHEVVEHVYLTNTELDIIYNADLRGKKYLERVRDLFLIGCHTGLRFSDFTQLSKENLSKTETGNYILTIKTRKTNEKVVIPVKPIVMEIWNKYNGELPRAISNQKMNEYIKELVEIAGINEQKTIVRARGKERDEKTLPKSKLVSTHTARRSFATNAFLSGIPSISIMKITGHRSETSFLKYIKVSSEENTEKLSNHKFFN